MVEPERVAAATGEVAIMIEQRERVAVLENSGRLIDQRIMSSDVIRLRDLLRFGSLRIRGHGIQAAALPKRLSATRR